jgi:hypothetical protein
MQTIQSESIAMATRTVTLSIKQSSNMYFVAFESTVPNIDGSYKQSAKHATIEKAQNVYNELKAVLLS